MFEGFKSRWQHRAFRRRMMAASVLGVLALGGAATAATQGSDQGGDSHGHRHGWHRMDPAKMQAHFEARLDKALRDVGASDQQRQQIKDIADRTFADIKPLREGMQNRREDMRKALTAPTVDAAQLESLRASHVQRMDQISKRITQGIADAANVLTPEQRAKLAERFDRFGPFRGA